MSFRTAVLIILSLLAVPLAGILLTVFLSGEQPKQRSVHSPKAEEAKAEPKRRGKNRPDQAEKRQAAPLEPEDPLPVVTAAPSSVILSGDTARSATGLAGRLSWVDDGEGSRITNPCPVSGCLDERGAKLCAKGKVAHFATKAARSSRTRNTSSEERARWGAELVWNLHEDSAGVHPLGKSKVAGLSFVLDLPLSSGPASNATDEKAAAAPAAAGKIGSPEAPPVNSPLEYLFALRVGDTDYCTPIHAGKNRVLFASLRQNCTAKKGRQKRIPAGIVAEAKSVKWKVPSLESTNERFDFCITDLRTLER
jgi:hypothetical protein